MNEHQKHIVFGKAVAAAAYKRGRDEAAANAPVVHLAPWGEAKPSRPQKERTWWYGAGWVILIMTLPIWLGLIMKAIDLAQWVLL